MPGLLAKILNYNITPKQTVVGVDIGGSAVKIVELSEERGKAVLKNYGEIALGPYGGAGIGQTVSVSDEKVSQAISDILKESKIESRNTVMTIPLSSTLLSFVEVPAASEKDLAQIIPNEARKYIPVPITEVVLDWWALPERGESTKKAPAPAPKKSPAPESGGADAPKAPEVPQKTIEVVISAIHNETLQRFQRIQNSTGLEVGSFEIEIFSSIRSVIGRDMSPVAVLDIGAGMTKLAMVEYGIVKSYHIINKGSQDVTLAISAALGVDMNTAEQIKREHGLMGTGEATGKAAEAIGSILGYIFSETESSVASFQQKYGKEVGRVILVGGGSLLKNLIENARKFFNIQVELGNPFSKVSYPVHMESTLKEIGPEFAVALGAALKGLQKE